jgi:hypothetical protein
MNKKNSTKISMIYSRVIYFVLQLSLILLKSANDKNMSCLCITFDESPDHWFEKKNSINSMFSNNNKTYIQDIYDTPSLSFSFRIRTYFQKLYDRMKYRICHNLIRWIFLIWNISITLIEKKEKISKSSSEIFFLSFFFEKWKQTWYWLRFFFVRFDNEQILQNVLLMRDTENIEQLSRNIFLLSIQFYFRIYFL